MSSGVPVMNINRVVVDAPRRLPGGPWLDFVRRLCCPYSTHCVPHHKTRSSTRYLAPIVNCPSGGRRRRRRIEAEPRSLGEGWTSTEGVPAVHHLRISPLRCCHGPTHHSAVDILRPDAGLETDLSISDNKWCLWTLSALRARDTLTLSRMARKQQQQSLKRWTRLRADIWRTGSFWPVEDSRVGLRFLLRFFPRTLCPAKKSMVLRKVTYGFDVKVPINLSVSVHKGPTRQSTTFAALRSYASDAIITTWLANAKIILKREFLARKSGRSRRRLLLTGRIKHTRQRRATVTL